MRGSKLVEVGVQQSPSLNVPVPVPVPVPEPGFLCPLCHHAECQQLQRFLSGLSRKVPVTKQKK
jgi:hypothetical protein